MDQIFSLLKNPIIIGILSFSVTYFSLNYKEKQRMKKNPKSIKKPINMTIPYMVGALCWFLASSYYAEDEINEIINEVDNGDIILSIGNTHNEHSITTNNENASYHLLRKGEITIPDIDVFLDVNI